MKILVTGSSGFIGHALCKKLLKHGFEVVGVDNMNDYYDVGLKKSRLKDLLHLDGARFKAIENDIEDKSFVKKLFKEQNFDRVIHLAAQAGVRYSIENPDAYIASNINGFLNILQESKNHEVEHFIYASSSSVYGMNVRQPFSTTDRTDFPVSLYAATKKSNELMAYSYSHLYDLPTTGLRFFTVYGPWGRPDMAYFKFTKSILEGNKINVYNNGNLRRDFTYIDDIVNGVFGLLDEIPENKRSKITSSAPKYALYNIGNNNSVNLIDFISSIEKACGKKANVNFLPMQPGDVYETYADIDDLNAAIGFLPETLLDEGMGKFVEWYKNYYKV